MMRTRSQVPCRQACAAALLLLLIAAVPDVKAGKKNKKSSDKESEVIPNSAVCKIVVQGEVDACKAKAEYEVCQVDILCVGDKVRVEGHSSFKQFSDKFKGVEFLPKKNPGQLIKLTSPSNITIIDSSFNNLKIKADMFIMAVAGLEDKPIHLSLFRTGFYNNTGKYISPLHLKGVHLNAVNATFVSNRAQQAGAMVMTDCVVDMDASSFSGGGLPDKAPEAGVFFMSNSSLTIKHSGVTKNYGRVAGVAYLDNQSALIIDSSDMVNNSAVPNKEDAQLTAGAIFATGASKVELIDMPLKENAGPHAGAVLASNGSTVSATGTQVHKNDSEEGMGAFVLVGDAAELRNISGIHKSSKEEQEEEEEDEQEEEGNGSGSTRDSGEGWTSRLFLSNVQFKRNMEFDITCGTGMDNFEGVDVAQEIGGGGGGTITTLADLTALALRNEAQAENAWVSGKYVC